MLRRDGCGDVGTCRVDKFDCLLGGDMLENDLQRREPVNQRGEHLLDKHGFSVEDVDIAIIFVEQPNESVKVSWRAQKGFDVSQIAYSFGGGGHKPAAGAEIKGDLDFVKTEVLNATRNYLNNH